MTKTLNPLPCNQRGEEASEEVQPWVRDGRGEFADERQKVRVYDSGQTPTTFTNHS